MIKSIIYRYINDVKKKLGLDFSQKCLLLWNAFKVQALNLFNARWAEHGHDTKNHDTFIRMAQWKRCKIYRLNHKRIVKWSQKRCNYHKYYSKLSALKPKHGKVMCQIYEYVKSEKGKSIILLVWKAAGITKAFKKGCAGEF